MKGIAHFISGVALTSFCPWAVEAASRGNPLYFILGGAFGVLPDTLDFKFYRFFYRHDLLISPTGKPEDPQIIADKLAGAIEESRSKKDPVRVKLNTLRKGADLWQQYSLKFDQENSAILVRYGPLVNTGQTPIPGTLSKDAPVGYAKLSCPIKLSYEAETTVDIFDGPSFSFQKTNGKITIHFLPWHRSWTHSLIIGCGLGLLIALPAGWGAGVISCGAYSIHILEDQLGFMGSNLFFPFSSRRTAGMRYIHSGNSAANFLTVWLSCLLIFWNLSRLTPGLTQDISLLQVLLLGLILPAVVVLILHNLLNQFQSPAGS